MVSGEIEGSLSSSKMIFWNRISFTKLDATKFILELFDPVKVQFLCSNTGLNHISRIFWISFLPNVVSYYFPFYQTPIDCLMFQTRFQRTKPFSVYPKRLTETGNSKSTERENTMWEIYCIKEISHCQFYSIGFYMEVEQLNLVVWIYWNVKNFRFASISCFQVVSQSVTHTFFLDFQSITSIQSHHSLWF